MRHRFLRCSLVALGMFMMFLFPTTVPIAHAQKDQFVRSKPHVNVGSVRCVYRGNDRVAPVPPTILQRNHLLVATTDTCSKS